MSSKIKIELKDNPNGYSFAVGRLDKDLDDISQFESKDKKKMIEWLNATIIKNCKDVSEDNLWFCFNYRDKTNVYTIEEIALNMNDEGVFTI